MFRTVVLAVVLSLSISVVGLSQNLPKAPGARGAPGTPPGPGAIPPGTTMIPGAMAGAAPGMTPGMTPDMQKMLEQMQQQLLSRFDTDRNGVLSDQEKLLAQEAMSQQGINLGIPPGGFPGSDQFAKMFDRDGDGKLNFMEAMAAQEAFQRSRHGGGGMRGGLRGGVGGGGGSAVPQQPMLAPSPADSKATKSGSALVKRFDKDGDGKLNAEEKAAAQAELKKGKGKDAKAKDADGKKD